MSAVVRPRCLVVSIYRLITTPIEFVPATAVSVKNKTRNLLSLEIVARESRPVRGNEMIMVFWLMQGRNEHKVDITDLR